LDFVKNVGGEANMPFGVGGGIRTIADIRAILGAGAEKVILNSVVFKDPEFIKRASDNFGSSTIVVCLDVKKDYFGRYHLVYKNGCIKYNCSIEEFVPKVAEFGAGEVIIQAIDRDGTYQGYDIKLLSLVSESIPIPVVALGGAGNYKDLTEVYYNSNVSAVAAGSVFIYHGVRRAVLINYPSKYEIQKLFKVSK